jgi:hypothetical protein
VILSSPNRYSSGLGTGLQGNENWLCLRKFETLNLTGHYFRARLWLALRLLNFIACNVLQERDNGIIFSVPLENFVEANMDMLVGVDN